MNKQGFLATFRVDEDLWSRFRAIAKDHKTNASALIVSYIEAVVSAGEVTDFGVTSVQGTDTLSIQQIDLMIDERIKSLQQSTNSLSVQDIDKSIDERLGGIDNRVKKLINQNMPVFPDEWELSQLVRKEINNSLIEGDIAAKLERNRENIVNHLNEINERLVKVEGALTDEKKPELTDDEKPELANKKKPKSTTKKEPTEADKDDVIKVLGIQKILSDKKERYSQNSKELFDLVEKNKDFIESKLRIKVEDMRWHSTRGFNKIIKTLGYKYDSEQVKCPSGLPGKRLTEYFVTEKL